MQQLNGVLCAVGADMLEAGQLVRVSAVQCSVAKCRVSWCVSELVRELQFNRCELLLLEADS
jgi:hypothetical protein